MQPHTPKKQKHYSEDLPMDNNEVETDEFGYLHAIVLDMTISTQSQNTEQHYGDVIDDNEIVDTTKDQEIIQL